MTTNLNPSEFEKCGLDSSTTWESVYHFLRACVRYWVCSAPLSLWCGQEEEIVEDIVQDAIMCTFLYIIKSSLWNAEGDDVPYIDLANRVQFDIHPMVLLPRAFLKQGIQLERCRRLLALGVHSKYEALLRFAYEKINEEETSETIDEHQEQDRPDNGVSDTLESDLELASLAVYLEATAPPSLIDPVFRQALRNQLLEMSSQ